MNTHLDEVTRKIGFVDAMDFSNTAVFLARKSARVIPHARREEFIANVQLAAVASVVKARVEPDCGPKWLAGLVRHKLFDEIKNAARNRAHERTVEDFSQAYAVVAGSDVSPVEAVERSEEFSVVMRSLEKMASDVQLIVRLRIWGDLRWKEIAELLSLPVTSVQSKARRAFAQLRECLD